MTGVPWLVPSPRLGGISAETRRALGPLATLIDDPRVTDVFVLGGGRVYVDTGRGTFAAEGLHLSHTQALDIARALIESGGRHVDDAQPLVDVSLPGGLRVHVTLVPVATAGTEISLRVARHRAPELTSLEIEHSERFIPWVISAGEPCGMARDLLQKAGVEMVLCEESEDSVVVQGRRTSGLHSVIATARAGVVDGGEK
jgi:type IV secretory pathway ATPase VirB11/archaellum biosynthesis ATPase